LGAAHQAVKGLHADWLKVRQRVFLSLLRYRCRRREEASAAGPEAGALPDASSPLFEPSWFHETLTQYFTYQHILKLRDPALLHAFEAMSAKQAPPYRAWQRLRDLPIEDARSWFMSVRRGVVAAPLSVQMLLGSMREVC